MTHSSPLFGPVQYDKHAVIQFPDGVGFAKDRSGHGARYILHRDPDTAPVMWLLALAEGGPEIPVMDPRLLEPAYTVQGERVSAEALRHAGTRSMKDVDAYAVITPSKDGTQAWANLRSPVLVNRRSGQAFQLSAPGMWRWPARWPIYAGLADSSSTDEIERRVVELSSDEIAHIGTDVTVQGSVAEDGVPRVAVLWPEALSLERGKQASTRGIQNVQTRGSGWPGRLAALDFQDQPACIRPDALGSSSSPRKRTQRMSHAYGRCAGPAPCP